MAKLEINLRKTGDTFLDDHHADISNERDIFCEVDYAVRESTNTFKANFTYYISQAAKTKGALDMDIFKEDYGQLLRAPRNFTIKGLDKTTFDDESPKKVVKRLRDQLEIFFGDNTVSIV